MAKFRTGNVIKNSYGHIVIVTKVTDKNVHWISFDCDNCSGISSKEDEIKVITCDCYNDFCEKCNETGIYNQITPGFNNSILLGKTVKDYIINSLIKNFNF